MQAYSFAHVVQLTLLDLWSRVVSVLPDILGALIIVIIGLIFAPLLGGLVKKIVDVLKIDDVARKLGVHDMVQGYADDFSIGTLIGRLVKWFFIIAFLMAAAEVLGWERVTMFLNEIVFYIPQVLVAVVILVVSVMSGKLFETIVTRSLVGASAPIGKPELMGVITRWAFVLFGALAALLQLGIAPSLIEILFAGIVFALALAFGLGGRKKAEELLDRVDEKVTVAKKRKIS